MTVTPLCNVSFLLFSLLRSIFRIVHADRPGITNSYFFASKRCLTGVRVKKSFDRYSDDVVSFLVHSLHPKMERG